MLSSIILLIIVVLATMISGMLSVLSFVTGNFTYLGEMLIATVTFGLLTIKTAKLFDKTGQGEKMGIFKNKKTPDPKNDEYVWIWGYKGTDENMCCKDFHFELNKTFEFNEKTEKRIKGFLLCENLQTILECYSEKHDKQRFFKIKALVKKQQNTFRPIWGNSFRWEVNAKSIIFVEEIHIDELLKDSVYKYFPQEHKRLILDVGLNEALVKILIDDGYSENFSRYIMSKNIFYAAHAIGTQEGLSINEKIHYVLNIK